MVVILDKINKEDSVFWAQAKADYEEVLTWPQWMQDITINAKTCASGQFNKGKDE